MVAAFVGEDLFTKRVIVVAGDDVAVAVGVYAGTAEMVVGHVRYTRRIIFHHLLDNLIFSGKSTGRVVDKNDIFVPADLSHPAALAIILISSTRRARTIRCSKERFLPALTVIREALSGRVLCQAAGSANNVSL